MIKHQILLGILLVSLVTPALAEPPPNLPLPSCKNAEGEEVGACPTVSAHVSGSASGRFGGGVTLTVTTDPQVPVCMKHNANTDVWEPSPCYASVDAIQVADCVFIDMGDNNRFKQLPCAQALYHTRDQLPIPLITVSAPEGKKCGDRPDFYTFIWGGPYTQEHTRWMNRGENALNCLVKFLGPKPDGMYGPTWVRMRARINVGVTAEGNWAYGSPKVTEFYVPVDGDMRALDGADLTVLATADLDESGETLKATYRMTLKNIGKDEAENFQVRVTLPDELRFTKASHNFCDRQGASGGGGNLTGGFVMCEGLTLDANASMVIEIEGRITNAADLKAVQFRVNPTRAVEEYNYTNNFASASVEPTFRGGSVSDTKTAMQEFNNRFDYYSPSPANPLHNNACNTYMDEILAQIEELHREAPGVFADLSYGKITSQPADRRDGDSASGHYGVVVYLKGSNYHKTGIIIHGTAGPSRYPFQPETQIGDLPLDTPREAGYVVGTSLNSMYFRTPVRSFQGTPRQERNGFGFEGDYLDEGEGSGGSTCAFAPDAVAVSTASPVEIHVKNGRGERVQTKGSEIAIQELDNAIHSYSFPHDDGTYAWNLILPRDRYTVDLVGVKSGPYTLTLTTYGEDGQPNEVVSHGTITAGEVDTFTVNGTASETPGENESPTTESSGCGVAPGASSMAGLIFALIYLPRIARKRNKKH